MPTAPPPSHDAAFETIVFWQRLTSGIIALLTISVLAVIGFTGYRCYSDRQAAAASALLASAKSAQDYQQVIDRYPKTPAGADAYLLLAEAQRGEKKFAEANATLQVFITKNPHHEFVSTARMAMAANLESMGKSDEALSMYQQIASTYPTSFTAPLALLSQVYILKTKNRIDDARRIAPISFAPSYAGLDGAYLRSSTCYAHYHPPEEARARCRAARRRPVRSRHRRSRLSTGRRHSPFLLFGAAAGLRSAMTPSENNLQSCDH